METKKVSSHRVEYKTRGNPPRDKFYLTRVAQKPSKTARVFGRFARRGGNSDEEPSSLPEGRRSGELLVEALLAEQPVRRHLALALDVGRAAVLDVVAADLRQSVPRRLAQVDAPWRPGGLHPRGGVHRVTEQAVARHRQAHHAGTARACRGGRCRGRREGEEGPLLLSLDASLKHREPSLAGIANKELRGSRSPFRFPFLLDLYRWRINLEGEPGAVCEGQGGGALLIWISELELEVSSLRPRSATLPLDSGTSGPLEVGWNSRECFGCSS